MALYPLKINCCVRAVKIPAPNAEDGQSTFVKSCIQFAADDGQSTFAKLCMQVAADDGQSTLAKSNIQFAAECGQSTFAKSSIQFAAEYGQSRLLNHAYNLLLTMDNQRCQIKHTICC